MVTQLGLSTRRRFDEQIEYYQDRVIISIDNKNSSIESRLCFTLQTKRLRYNGLTPETSLLDITVHDELDNFLSLAGVSKDVCYKTLNPLFFLFYLINANYKTSICRHYCR